MGLERLFGGSDQRGMIGKSEIIVCTHVEHTLAARDRNVRILRTRDDTLGFEKTLRFNFFQSLSYLIFEFGDHIATDYTDFAEQEKRTESISKMIAAEWSCGDASNMDGKPER
jgi:hypothetical protein